MQNEPIWLDAQSIIRLNVKLVALTGEPHFVRDQGLLESACAVPINRFFYDAEQDVVSLGVALMIAIARNHPFAQGNKRTGFAAGAILLDLNGYCLTLEDDAQFADLFVEVIQGHAPSEALADVLRANVTPVAGP